MSKQNGKIRSVDQYLALLKAAARSDTTIRNYRQVLKLYAAFLGVPLDQLHNNLDADDFVRYATAISGMRESGKKSTMSVISRFMRINGVVFDELEQNVAKVRLTEERTDKPLTTALLQKMMDQASPHGKAIISFLISTGCRAGETSQLLLSDVGRIENERFVPDINGSVVQVRNEIAKRKHGGIVFLSREAREYLSAWLNVRNQYICNADMRTKQLYVLTGGERHARTPRKDIGTKVSRPVNDQRLFACSYKTLDSIFSRLYLIVDGERRKNGNKVTAHGCRAYFRTNAAKAMGIDFVEGILRHTGYLNAAYVRWTLADRERMFHEGEAALYITRADHRVQSGQLDALRWDNERLSIELAKMKENQDAIQKIDAAANEKIIAEVLSRLQKVRGGS